MDGFRLLVYFGSRVDTRRGQTCRKMKKQEQPGDWKLNKWLLVVPFNEMMKTGRTDLAEETQRSVDKLSLICLLDGNH